MYPKNEFDNACLVNRHSHLLEPLDHEDEEQNKLFHANVQKYIELSEISTFNGHKKMSTCVVAVIFRVRNQVGRSSLFSPQIRCTPCGGW